MGLIDGLISQISSDVGIGGAGGSTEWADITSTPTTLVGYGITDAQPLDTDLTAIAALTPTANDLLQYRSGAWTTLQPDFLTSRNVLINGAMSVDQRNSGGIQTITAGAALAYTIDRWYAYCTGANVTGQRVQGASQNRFRYRFTGAASNTSIQFGQRIEALNSVHLAGRICTLSVDLANSLLTTVTWTAFYANTTNAFGSIASPTRTQIATGTFTVNSTIARYSTQISIPAAATTGIEIVFSVVNQTSGTWTIGDVQLEPGTVATPFERRSYGQELALCQRYYEVGEYAFSMGISHASIVASYYTWVNFQARKPATPTVTGTNDQGRFDTTIIAPNGCSLGRNNVIANRINSGTFVASAEL